MRGPRRPCSRASTLAITPVTPGAPIAIVRTCSSWITGIGRAALTAQPTDYDLATPKPRPQRCLLPSRPETGVEAISAVAAARLWRASSPVVREPHRVINHTIHRAAGGVTSIIHVGSRREARFP